MGHARGPPPDGRGRPSYVAKGGILPSVPMIIRIIRGISGEHYEIKSNRARRVRPTYELFGQEPVHFKPWFGLIGHGLETCAVWLESFRLALEENGIYRPLSAAGAHP